MSVAKVFSCKEEAKEDISLLKTKSQNPLSEATGQK